MGERFGTRTDIAGAFFNSFGASAVKTLPEQLAEKLVEQIIRGDFTPGQRLHEMRLAEQFQVSRGPVREALRLLEREGLVVMLSHRGASVARLTEKRLKDIFSVRSALMAICAEELAELRSKTVQATLDDGTAKLFAASDRGMSASISSLFISSACISRKRRRTISPAPFYFRSGARRCL